jgi:ABC-type antimicrobial peptide transport system permease subunit
MGIFGVVSYVVGQRTPEIGIRMALGADRTHVIGMVMGQGVLLTVAGVALGLAGAAGLTRFLSTLLYGVQPTDPMTFAAAAAVLAAVSLTACALPARRASRVDPTVALRYE